MKRIAEFLARVLKKLDRKYLLVSWQGEVYIERYYILFPPLNQLMTKLPNVYLHRFPTNIPDEFDHDHARWCISIVLHGGYTETRNGKLINRPRFSISMLKSGDMHRIKTIQPDTWTFFIVGPRFREMNFYWPEDGKILSRVDLKVEESSVGGRHKETPEFLKKIERRRKALSKVNHKTIEKINL